MKVKTLFLALFLLSACSNPLGNKDSIVDQGHRPGQEEISIPNPTPAPPAVVYHAGAGSTMVNSAAHLQTTSRGYKVSQTVGELSSDLNASTSRGYYFFSNLHGVLVSE